MQYVSKRNFFFLVEKYVVASEEEFEEFLLDGMTYEDFAKPFEWIGTWKLDNDTLTIQIGGNSQSNTAETELSKGKTSFTFFNINESDWDFEKIK